MKNNNCPVSGHSFCWKNPVHVVVFLAVLPFALAGAKVLWSAVTSAFATLPL
jgi:hypothetical protein